jgi:hypothetical protein
LRVARIERGSHQPGSFTGGDDSYLVTRQTTDDTASERTADETEWIDTDDACTKNLLQVSA